MIIDGKYHAASLIAVFLALGVGIMIGCLMVGEAFTDNIVARQEAIINRLESDYGYLKKEARSNREEMEKVKEESESYKEYALYSLPYVLKDKLMGKKIAIIEKTAVPEFFLENLELAGADIISITSFDNNIAKIDESELTKLAAFFDIRPEEDKIPELLAARLAEIILGGEKSYYEILQKLNIRQQIKGAGAADTAVFVVTRQISQFAGGEETNIDILLAKQLMIKGLKVFHAESGLSESSDLFFTIDSIPGQVSLIFSIAGQEYK